MKMDFRPCFDGFSSLLTAGMLGTMMTLCLLLELSVQQCDDAWLCAVQRDVNDVNESLILMN